LFCSLVRSWDNKMLGFFCSFSTTAGCSGCGYSEERWVWDPGHGRRYNGQRAVGCRLPRLAFLAAVRGKHVAFVGDPMACIRPSRWSASRTPIRRWAFPSHNVTVSSYWAPFLVRAAAANYSVRYNSAHLAERWSTDADTMDVAVINTDHWFWERAARQRRAPRAPPTTRGSASSRQTARPLLGKRVQGLEKIVRNG
jgi:hypothetical protein